MLLRLVSLIVLGLLGVVLVSCAPQQFSRENLKRKSASKVDEFQLHSPDKIATNSYHQLGITGGKAPYSIEIMDGPGLVSPAFILMANENKGRIRVKATDGQNTVRFAEIEVMDECDLGQTNCTPTVIDMEPPEVEIKDPPQKAKCKKDVDIEFTVTDNIQVAKVQCYLDDQLVEDDCKSPFRIDNIKKGKRKVKIKAIDTSNNESEEEIEIKVECC